MKQETVDTPAGSAPVQPDAGYRRRNVPVAGGMLRVGIWGPEPAPGADVPTVLAVHGITASHRAWPMLAAALPGVRVVAPDLRGRGRSNLLPGPYGMGAHARDLAAVLDSAGAGRAVVVGHSMGAFAAMVLAHLYPARVSELVLVDGGLPLQVPQNVSEDELLAAVLGPAAERLSMTFSGHGEYKEFWKQHPAFARCWNDTVEEYVRYDLVKSGAAFQPATRYDAVAEDSRELHGGDSLLKALAELDHPATFLRAPRGLLDAAPLYFPEQIQQWKAELPGLRTADVEDVNHYTIIMSEHGIASVAQAVKAALGSSRRPAGTN